MVVGLVAAIVGGSSCGGARGDGEDDALSGVDGGELDSDSGVVPTGDARNALGEGVPRGAVMFFNLEGCPSGWSLLTEAQGRYLVGVPNGGERGAAIGVALEDKEDRPVGQHSHQINDPGHSHGAEDQVLQENGEDRGGGLLSHEEPGETAVASTGITIRPAGAKPGTNAPYLQLLICQKD